MKRISFIYFTLSVAALAQGTLTPPSGTPMPTQKSLQEIWDKLEALETEIARNQEATVTGMEALFAHEGIPLPWKEIETDVNVVMTH